MCEQKDILRLLNYKPLSLTKERRLFRQIRYGTPAKAIQAKNKLVRYYLKLVYKCTLNYTNLTHLSQADLFQFGCIGLIEAVDNFDTTKSKYFLPYAKKCVFGHVNKSTVLIPLPQNYL